MDCFDALRSWADRGTRRIIVRDDLQSWSVLVVVGVAGCPSPSVSEPSLIVVPAPQTAVETVQPPLDLASIQDAVENAASPSASITASAAPATTHPEIRSGRITISDGLPPEVVMRIVRQNFGRVRLCYESALRSDPTLSDTVSVHFTIDADGGVSKSRAEPGPLGELEACVARVFLALAFPKPQHGSMDVVLPVILSLAPGPSPPPPVSPPDVDLTSLEWARQYGGPGNQRALDVTVTDTGSIVVLGLFDGSADFGTTHLTPISSGSNALFVAWFDAHGTPRTARTYGDPGPVLPGRSLFFQPREGHLVLVAAPGGDALLAGTVHPGTLDFGGGPIALAPEGTGFVARLAGDGSPRWSRTFEGRQIR